MWAKSFGSCVVLGAVLSLTGCCRWCERHCPHPTTACQPCVPCCPAPATTTQACQPCTPLPCCPTPVTSYTAPTATTTHSQQGWQRTPNGCCP
jgi:hypothetical protein